MCDVKVEKNHLNKYMKQEEKKLLERWVALMQITVQTMKSDVIDENCRNLFSENFANNFSHAGDRW